jgi:predicted enzyme related to lactoylglutathione lyase
LSGRVVHFEIPYDDEARAHAFYTEASEQGPPSEPGFINGGMLERGLPVAGPVIVMDVADIDASLKEIGRLGGTTVSGKQPVGDMGFSAYFKDTEGNLLGLWQSS